MRKACGKVSASRFTTCTALAVGADNMCIEHTNDAMLIERAAGNAAERMERLLKKLVVVGESYDAITLSPDEVELLIRDCHEHQRIRERLIDLVKTHKAGS
ncbi:MAG: hypothetical protein A2Z03_11965 [Chloroflexi bacterium RBG_16_56_8]|nr:MAG: hypothetical protein A2Z03_11965 [Chloroflexi bacterium RBG_16_56_8]OHD23848.1 MAG: hypothetical protein A2Y38_17310 [Spirochaetes bacterium GWB1_59_5]